MFGDGGDVVVGVAAAVVVAAAAVVVVAAAVVVVGRPIDLYFLPWFEVQTLQLRHSNWI